MTAEEKWLLDSNRINSLKSLGYEIIIFWEFDIKNDIKKIQKELEIFLK